MMCGRHRQRLIGKCPTGLLNIVMLVAIFAIAIAINAPTAQARTSKECLAHQITPELVFRVQNAKTTLNRSKSSSQITAFAKSIDAFKPTTKGRLLGLAFTQTQSNIGVGGQSVPVKHRKTCMRLVKVSFEFGFHVKHAEKKPKERKRGRRGRGEGGKRGEGEDRGKHKGPPPSHPVLLRHRPSQQKAPTTTIQW